MSVSRRHRSPLSIADEVFTALVTGPSPLSLNLGADPGIDRPETATPQTAQPDRPAPDSRAAAPSNAPAASEPSVWEPSVWELVALDRVRDLMCQPDTPLSIKNRVWSLLVGRAQRHGGAWTVGAVGVALPPLVRLATELASGDPDGRAGRAELDAEILAGFLHGLATADPAATALFPKLMRAARDGGLAWLRHQRGADTPMGEQFSSAPPPRPWGHPDLVLSDAVTAGVITAAEAALIGATRLDREPIPVHAARLGEREQAVWKRRRRAEHRLAAWITRRSHDTDHAHDPTSAHALDTPTPTTRPIQATTAVRATGRTGGRSVNSAATAHRTSCPGTAPVAPSYSRANPRPQQEAAA